MAGDWIKMRTDLYRDPKVSMMADELMRPDGELAKFVSQHCRRDISVTRNVMRNVTVGALVSVWGVLRTRGKRSGNDLIVSGATLAVLDDLADLPGFGQAMALVNWAVQTEEGIVCYRFFEDFNVDPDTDGRAKNAERQRRYREKKAENTVTLRNDHVTSQNNAREEKRREEKRVEPNGSTPMPNIPAEKTKLRKTRIPKDFGISESVRVWAVAHGFGNLETHLESFVLKCDAKGYTYIDWDKAFMNAIRDNWAKVGNGQSQSKQQALEARNAEAAARWLAQEEAKNESLR